MVVDPLALRVDYFILSVAVLELVTRFVDVRVMATVLEGTFATTFVKQAARDLAKRVPVLLAKRFLSRTRCMEI